LAIASRRAVSADARFSHSRPSNDGSKHSRIDQTNKELPMPTNSELAAIAKAVSDSGAVRIKKANRAALAAVEAGECHAYTVGAWMNAQKTKRPELFVAKSASNPWSPSFPADKKLDAIASYIRTFGSAASSRMAASCDVDLAGRPLRKRA
jgi:hypothetical protein